MGGISFTDYQYGTSIKDAWEKAYADAAYQHGAGSYNGSLTTCSLGRCTLTFDKYTKENERKAYEFITDKEHYGEKWVAKVVDLGVAYCEIVTAKKVAKKADAKFELKYSVKEDGKELRQFKDKKTADNFAVDLASKHPHNSVQVCKAPCKVSGSTICTEFKVETKKIDNPKKSDLAKKGCIAYHKYIFYGFASC